MLLFCFLHGAWNLKPFFVLATRKITKTEMGVNRMSELTDGRAMFPPWSMGPKTFFVLATREITKTEMGVNRMSELTEGRAMFPPWSMGP